MKKKFIHFLSFLFLLLLSGVIGNAQVNNITASTTHADLQDAISAAAGGDTLQLTQDLNIDLNIAANTISVNKQLTIDGNNNTITTFGGNALFSFSTAGSILQNVNITKTDKTSQGIIYVGGNNITLDAVHIKGEYVLGDIEVSRGMVVASGNDGLNVKNSSFEKLRQPAYINGGITNASIENNYVAHTRGWVVVADAQVVFNGNTWGSGIDTNATDIAIIDNSPSIPQTSIYFQCPVMVLLIANNNNPKVDNQVLVGGCNVHNVTQNSYYYSIKDAVDAANANDVIEILDDLTETDISTVNKKLTIKGNNHIVSINSAIGGSFPPNGLFVISPAGAGTTIQDLGILKTDNANQNLIYIDADNVTIDNVKFEGQWTGESTVVAGIFVNYYKEGLNIKNSEFRKLRQAIKLADGIKGNVTNNASNQVFQVAANTEIIFSGNTGIPNTNGANIEIITGFFTFDNYYTCLVMDDIKVNNANVSLSNTLLNPSSCNRVNNVTQSTWTYTIQAAVDLANNGDRLLLSAGTYTESVSTTYAGKQVDFEGEVDGLGNPLATIKGGLYLDNADGRYVKNLRFEVDASDLLTLKNTNGFDITNCIFDGNIPVGNNGEFLLGKNGIVHVSGPNGNSDVTVKDCKFENGLYVAISSRITNLTVLTSSFQNVKSGINHQGGNNLVVTDCDFSVEAQANTSDTYGIRFASSVTENAIVSGSKFVVDKNSFVATGGDYHAAIIVRATAGGTMVVSESSILGEVVNLSAVSLTATCNWWGTSVANDIATKVSGDVNFVNYLIPVTTGGQTYPWSGTNNYDCLGSPIEIATVLTDGINCSQGSIEVSFTGGTAPYNLTWNGGSVSNVTSPYTIANLATGTYNITITDAANSSDNATVLLTNYPVTNSTNNTYHTTISAAITNATDGDVLEVCAGTYTETINVNKSITLNGPNAGIDPNTGVRVGEAILSNASFKATGNKTVVIDGFTIERTGTNTNHGIDLTAGATTVTVQNNIFNRNVSVAGTNAYGVYLSSSSAQKIIRNNFFTGRATYSSTGSHRTWRSGIWYNGGNVTVQDNVMENCNTHINIEQSPANLVIDGNSFSRSSTSFAIGSISAVQAAYFTFGANDFASTISTIINVTSTVDDACRFDISAGSYGGTPFADLTLAQKFTVDGKIYHRTRTKGLVYFVSKNIFNNTINSGQIQTAISYAAAGDTITIANKLFNGTYTEALVIDKSLTLQGQSKANVRINGTTGVNSGIKINSGIVDVTIRDLTIQNVKGTNGNTHAGIYAVGNNNNLFVDNVFVNKGTSGSNASGFYANGPIDGLTINGSEFNNHGTDARGIVVWNGLKTNIAITNNTLANNNCCGIELSDGDASAVTVTGNTISIGDGDNAIGLIGLNGSVGPNLISNNTITGGGRFGIEIKNPNGGVTVSNNNVTLSSQNSDVRDRAGIAVYRRGVLNNNVDVPNGVTITGNIVTGYQQNSTSEGFGIVIEGSNHTVSGNTLNNNDIGILQQQNPSNYPGDADQSNVADNFFGRGNAPTTCANIIGTNTFSSNGEDYRLAGAVSGDIVNARTGNKYCSIQDAIDDAATINGDEINVGPGTYAENVVVNKSVSILGPNATIEACSGSRVGEAIIFPAISDIDDDINGTVFKVEASDVVISGFTLDGDNPNINTSKSSTNGADIDAAQGITRYGTGNNLVVTNNIIKNLSYAGVVMYDYPAGVASSGNVISGNMIQDLGSYDPTIALNNWGVAVLLYNNQYASVTNNCMTNVRLGVQTGNFSKANPGSVTHQVISNNTISSRRRGIFHNLQYSNASPITLENNSITAISNSNETLWDGILLSSLSVPSITDNNTIDGNSISSTTYGIDVWNVKNTSPALISGGVISNVKTGILIDNFVGYNSNGANGANATITNINVNASEIGISISDNTLSTTHGAVSAIVTGSSITAPLAVDITESATGIVSATFTGNSINSGAILLNSNASNTVDAECNWWGTTIANDISTNVSGAVDFLPYLIPSVSGVTYPWSASTTYSCDGTPIIISSANVTNHASCEDGEGSIALTWSGGTSSYSVSIDGGTASTATSPYTISNLNAGNRTVKVEDANGTFVEQVVTINTNPVKNSTTGLTYATIQDAVDAVGTTNGNELVLCDGPFDEQVIVNKSLSIIPATVSGSPTTPVVNFTGTSTGKPTLFDVSANNVSIEGIQFDVDMSKLKSAIIVSGSGIDAVTIKDNQITPFGIASSGTYSDRNAVSVNFAGNTNYRTSTGVNNITFEGNTVNPNATDGSNSFRAGISADAAGGSFLGNTITSINQDVQVRFATAPVTMTGNNLNGGGAEYTSPNSGAGSATISNNSFNGNWWIGLNPSNPVANPMLRLKNNGSGANTFVDGNTFTDIRWGISLENYNNNTISNNTFTPLATASDFRHITVNTKGIFGGNISTLQRVAISSTITDNIFNGIIGTNTGKGLAFYNHWNDGAGAQYGAFTVSGNTFNKDMQNYIYIDESNGVSTTDPSIANNYPEYADNGAAPSTTGYWTKDIVDGDNFYAVGGTGTPKLYDNMSLLEIYGDLYAHIYDQVDNSNIGLVIFGEKPDLEISTRINNPNFIAANNTISNFIVDVFELNGTDLQNTPATPVNIIVYKSSSVFDYTFDPNQTSMNMPMATNINNTNWELVTNNASLMVFKLKDGVPFNGYGFSSIGINIQVKSSASFSNLSINTIIPSNSGGETNIDNNSNARLVNIQ